MTLPTVILNPDGTTADANPAALEMLGVSLENTTSTDFRARFGGRYLAFDVLGSGAELRIDGAIGSG